MRTGGLLILVVCSTAVTAQGALRLAGSDSGFAALAAGPQAAAWNPANLGLFPQNRLELLGVQVGVGNSAFGLGDYRRYNGRYWDEDDKQAVLEKVGRGRLDVATRAALTAIGVSHGTFAFSTETKLRSQVGVPKEVLELALEGNPVNRRFDLGDLSGDGIAYSEARLSYAHPLRVFAKRLPEPWHRWQIGLSLKWLRGWAYGDLLDARGGFLTSNDAITGSGSLHALSALGGSGFAADLGFAGPLADGWVGSLAIQDLFGRILWSREVEDHWAEFSLDAVSLDDLAFGEDEGDEGEEDPFQSDSESARRGKVSVSLPVTFGLGAAHLGSRLHSSIWVVMATRSKFGQTTTPGLSIGVAYPARRWIVLRGFGGIGGPVGTRVGGGAGIGIGPLQLDLAVRTWKTLNPFNSKGVGFALGIGSSI